MGNAGMEILLLTNLSSQRDFAGSFETAAPRPSAGPGRGNGRRTGAGSWLREPIGRRLQLRAQRRNFAGFPLNRPRRAIGSWAAPWS